MSQPFFAPLFGYAGKTTLAVPVTALVTKGRGANGATVVNENAMTLKIGPDTRSGRLPVVSCLLVTKDRPWQARLAIAHYRQQTWPARELVILDQNESDDLADWVATLGDPTIRLHRFRATREPLGALRNHSVALARGDLICQWDDDDLQHPARLEIALAAMVATRSGVSMLAREIIWFPGLHRLGIMDRRPQENSLIAVRRSMPAYPALARGEDSPVVDELLTRHQAVLIDLPELYVYVAHGANTWDDGHMQHKWQTASDRNDIAAGDDLHDLLSRSYPLDEYEVSLAGRPPTEAR